MASPSYTFGECEDVEKRLASQAPKFSRQLGGARHRCMRAGCMPLSAPANLKAVNTRGCRCYSHSGLLLVHFSHSAWIYGGHLAIVIPAPAPQNEYKPGLRAPAAWSSHGLGRSDLRTHPAFGMDRTWPAILQSPTVTWPDDNPFTAARAMQALQIQSGSTNLRRPRRCGGRTRRPGRPADAGRSSGPRTSMAKRLPKFGIGR